MGSWSMRWRGHRLTQHIRCSYALPFGPLLPSVAMSYMLGMLYAMCKYYLPRFNPTDNRHLELASWSLKMHQGLEMPDEEGNKMEYLVEEVFRTQREWQQGIFSFVEVPHSV